ncbi:MAG: hypothetical protein NZ931_01590 [Aigarchaeota archaeon]|nr:hypothetical protein [Aigarchaeota archaeon]
MREGEMSLSQRRRQLLEINHKRTGLEKMAANLDRMIAENPLGIELILERKKIDEELKLLSEIQSEIMKEMEARRNELEKLLPAARKKYEGELLVLSEKLQKLSRSLDDFLSAFEEVRKQLDKTEETYRELFHIESELELNPVRKHPYEMFLNGVTLSRLQLFKTRVHEWIREVGGNG